MQNRQLEIQTKKQSKRLFSDQQVDGLLSNDMTFQATGNLIINSESRREDHSSFIEQQNDQISQGSPSLNQHMLGLYSSKVQLYDKQDKGQNTMERSEALQDSVQEIDKESPSLSNQPNSNQKQRSTRHSRSIFLSQTNRSHIMRAKQNMKTMLHLKGSAPSEKKFMNLRILAQIHKKMMYFLKNFTEQGRNKYIQNTDFSHIRKAIDDNGDYIQSQNKSQVAQTLKAILNFLCCMQLMKCIQQYKSSFMIVPNSLFNLLSLVFFCSFNCLFYFLLSIIIIYEGYMTYEAIIVYFILTVWLLDIIVQLNTQIYNKTNLISDRGKVFSEYLQKRAFYDLIPLAATFITIQTTGSLRKTLLGISFIKLKNVLNDINNMQKLLCMSVKNYHIIQLFNLIFKISILSHSVACVWYLIGQIELHILNYETTWYDHSVGADGVWWKLYLESMYWALTLMTTGSNIATSVPQMLYASFIMLFTAIIFGYMLNTTGIILSHLNQKDENKRFDLNIINDYMRSHKISKGLQGRVNLDLEYHYLNNLTRDQELKTEVIRKISPQLQDLLKLESCKQALDKFNFIYKKFSKETIQELSLEFEEEFYSPNQVIFAEKQINNISLIWIVQGQMQICSSYDRVVQPVQILKEGDIIGQVNFFTGLEYKYSVRSLDFTKVLKINREKFLEIVQKRKSDYEMFCYIKDRQQLYQEYQILQSKCGFCNTYSHFTTDCNLVHFDRQSCITKAKFLQNQTQQRSKQIRKDNYQNSYLIRLEVQKSISKFIGVEMKSLKLNGILVKREKQYQYSNDSDDSESDESIPMVSTFQIMSSQISSDGELDYSQVEPQKVRNQQYFDNHQLANLDSAKSNKKSENTTEKNEFNLQLAQQLHIDFVAKYSQQKPSTLSPELKKRYSFQIPEHHSKRNISINDNTKKRNSIQFTQLRKQNSIQVDEYSQQYRSKRKSIYENNASRSISTQQQQKQDQNHSHNETINTDRLKASNLGSPNNKLLHSSNKKIDFLKRTDSTNKQSVKPLLAERKTSIFQRQSSITHVLEEEVKEKKRSLFMLDFEKQSNWSVYFTSGNIAAVLQRQSKYAKKKMRLLIGSDRKYKERNNEKKLVDFQKNQ